MGMSACLLHGNVKRESGRCKQLLLTGTDGRCIATECCVWSPDVFYRGQTTIWVCTASIAAFIRARVPHDEPTECPAASLWDARGSRQQGGAYMHHDV